jgi:hypothetical protein
MQPVSFEGATEIKKPPSMTDEQCMSVWAKYGFTALVGFKVPPAAYTEIDSDNYRFFLTAWKPSWEDLQALNRGEPVYIKTIANGLPPMAVFTMDEKGNCNDAD